MRIGDAGTYNEFGICRLWTLPWSSWMFHSIVLISVASKPLAIPSIVRFIGVISPSKSVMLLDIVQDAPVLTAILIKSVSNFTQLTPRLLNPTNVVQATSLGQSRHSVSSQSSVSLLAFANMIFMANNCASFLCFICNCIDAFWSASNQAFR